MSEIKVNSIKGVGASAAAITVNNSDGTCTANITNRSNKNIIINGDMRVAQRGTSSTSNGYQTVDRYKPYEANTGVTPTYSQVDVTSGGAYDAGFRKALQITKGAGTANANSQVNVTNSGWKYKDPNSKITMSFWLKTSVSNHNPQLLVIDDDSGTAGTKYYQVDIPTLTADTWTKVTATIPGHADQVYNNDNGSGMEFQIIPWYGTDFTDASNTMNAWTTFGTKPVNSTWLTTNNSTFQITGIQLEVSDHATDFEHRSYGQELLLCQRYLYVTTGGGAGVGVGGGSNAVHRCQINLPVTMRAAPSVTMNGSTIYTYDGANSAYFNGFAAVHSTNQAIDWETSDSERTAGSVTAYRPVIAYINSSSGGVICSAEL